MASPPASVGARKVSRSTRLRTNRLFARVLLAAALLLPGRMLADFITVTTTADAVDGNTSSIGALIASPGGAGISLREAVIAANNTAAGAPHTINLPAGTYSLTRAGANEDAAATGDLDVTRSGLSLVGAGAGGTIIQQTTLDRVFDFNPYVSDSFSASLSGLTITGGNVSSSYGGGGIIYSGANVGSPGTLTINNAVITGNTATGGPGGGIEVSPSGNLSVTDSTISNNSASHAIFGKGGGVDVLFQSGVCNLTLTRCTISGNTAARSGGAGGGVYVTGNPSSTYTLNQCHLLNNVALNPGGKGGGLVVGGGALTATYCRILSNLANSGDGHAVFAESTGTAILNDDWWGANTGPAAGALGQNPGSPPPVAATWLQLRHTASPNTVVFGQPSTLTASFLLNSAGTPIAAGNLTVLIGQPISFHSAILGTISGAQTAIQSSGTATATFTAGNTPGLGGASATVDDATVSAAVTVNPLDYVVTTGGGAIAVTDQTGNGDTLTISEPAGAGTVKFAAPGRSFRIDGVTYLTGDSGNLSLAGINSITVNAQAGTDTINVDVFTGLLPSLTLNGGTGNDTVNFNGDLTFAPNANLDVDLQNDDATPGVDSIRVAGNANVRVSGNGTLTLKCSRNLVLNPGASLETVDGSLTVEANQQVTPNAGNFQGVLVNGGLIQAIGTGAVSVKGTGGNDVAGTQAGVLLSAGGSIVGGTSGLLTVEGTGGASSGTFNTGILLLDASTTITSSGAAVQVTGTGGGAGASIANYGIAMGTGGSIQVANSPLNLKGTAGLGAFGHGVMSDANSSSGVLATGSGAITIEATGNGSDVEFYNEAVGGMTHTIGGPTATGPVTVVANSANLGTSSGVSIRTTGTVTLRPRTNGGLIDLGGPDVFGVTPTLGLSDAELDIVTAGTLIIGDANSGNLTVSAPISPAHSAAFSLISGGTISDSYTAGPDVTVANLTTGGNLSPGASPGIFSVDGNQTLAANSTFTVEIGGATPGNGAGFHDQLSATGNVDIGPDVTLNAVPFGGFAPSPGETFVIIARAGGTGTFKDLPENATVTVNGVGLKISYAGGDGNDVTLSVPPPTAARLAYFRATATSPGKVRLSWGTLVEVGSLGFRVERRTSDGGWLPVTTAMVPAVGGDQRPHSYSLVDVPTSRVDAQRYRLVEIDLSGQERGIAEAEVEPAVTVQLNRQEQGLGLAFRGQPGAAITVESANSVEGPWEPLATVELDAQGAGAVKLEMRAQEMARFYRW